MSKICMATAAGCMNEGEYGWGTGYYAHPQGVNSNGKGAERAQKNGE